MKLTKCDFCGGKLIEAKKIYTRGSRCAEIIGNKCLKCGEFFASHEEVDKAVKKLNLSFMERLKEVFSSSSEKESVHSLFKGKVL